MAILRIRDLHQATATQIIGDTVLSTPSDVSYIGPLSIARRTFRYL